MSDNHRSMREISNQHLPNKKNFQTKWVDFPNHLHPKEEVVFDSEQEEVRNRSRTLSPFFSSNSFSIRRKNES